MRLSLHQTPPRRGVTYESLARQPLQFINQNQNQKPPMINNVSKRAFIQPQQIIQQKIPQQPILANYQIHYNIQQPQPKIIQKNSSPFRLHSVGNSKIIQQIVHKQQFQSSSNRTSLVRDQMSCDQRRGQIISTQIRQRAHTFSRPPQFQSQQRMLVTRDVTTDHQVSARQFKHTPIISSVNVPIPIQASPLKKKQPYQDNKTYRPQSINKSMNQLYAEKDDELVKKFEEAIERTKNLVQKYQKTEQEVAKLGRRKENLGTQNNQKQHGKSYIESLKDIALSYDDGFIYRGQGFSPSTREGYGILCDPEDNEVYFGYWKQNLYDGRGTLLNLQCSELTSNFDYTDLNQIENGWKQYEGDFKNGKMHGRGKLILTNNDEFDGGFNDGVIEGCGKYSDNQNPTKFRSGIWQDGYLVS